MERSTTYALQGAVLVTLLLGAQPTEAQAMLRHELSFDAHGRIVPTLAALPQALGLSEEPGTIPNIRC